MKSVFIMVLALNVSVFTYFIYSETQALPSKHEVIENRDAKNILLLSEVKAVEDRQFVKPSSRANEDFSLCVLYGPFKELLKAEYLIEILTARGIKGVFESVGGESNHVYFVLSVKTIGEPLDLKRRLVELSKQNINAHLYREGQDERIAFARYRDLVKAQNKIKELMALGISAEIVTREIENQDVWVRINKQDDQALHEDATIADFFIQNSVEKRIIRCLGVAKSVSDQ